MRLLRCKVITENLGEGTTVQEETARKDENESENRANYKYKRDRVAFVFYDFETQQDETCEGNENVQILCVGNKFVRE